VEMIRRAMEETRGNQLRSAMILGINRSTLKKRLMEMREAGIKVFSEVKTSELAGSGFARTRHATPCLPPDPCRFGVRPS